MAQCSHYIVLEFKPGAPIKYGPRCTAQATVRLLTPEGNDCPGSRMCEEHAQLVIKEYTEKLHENWGTRELTEIERF